MKMKFSMPLKKEEVMDPILPITSPDASKVEEKPDVVADGKLDAAISMKLSKNSDIIQPKVIFVNFFLFVVLDYFSNVLTATCNTFHSFLANF